MWFNVAVVMIKGEICLYVLIIVDMY